MIVNAISNINIHIRYSKKQIEDMRTVADNIETIIQKNYPKLLEQIRGAWSGDLVEKYIRTYPQEEIDSLKKVVKELRAIADSFEKEVDKLEKIEKQSQDSRGQNRITQIM